MKLLYLILSFLAAGCGSSKHSQTAQETTSSDSLRKPPYPTISIVPDSVELPAPVTDKPEQILRRKGYTASYNKETLMPNWVAWVLTREHTDGPYTRKGHSFHEDFDVPEPRTLHRDYTHSGWSRGHMCPSGDNKWDSIAQNETFLMTNICPQNQNLNNGDWNEMETLCRMWAKKYGRIYIVCGPILPSKEEETERIGENKVAVPSGFFKVVLCLEGKPKGIGFVYKNKEGNRPKGDYVNAIREMERITGYDFFPSLPDDVEEFVEKDANLDDW